MKRSITNSFKGMKILFVSRGPGETGQARALAKFFAKKNLKIIFCLHQEKNLSFLEGDKEFKIFLTPTPEKLKEIVEKEKPEILFLFNSKMWDDGFKKSPPFLKPRFVFGVDSNWLFNAKKYPSYKFVEWADLFFILFPKKIFELGLKENGGNFVIEKKIREKILPIGFVPSYPLLKFGKKEKIRKKLGIRANEKFIFSYFSGWGAGHRKWALENMIKAVDLLIRKGRKIKVLYVGPIEGLNLEKMEKNWLMVREKLPAKEYFLILASSDLIFMHQGMVTLAQAISSQVPVICNVSILKEKLPKLHFWEVLPFKRAEVCEMLTKSTKTKTMAQKIEGLLFEKEEREKMKKRQRKIFEAGEKRIFEEIKKLL